jgi:hypothetical protein
VFLKTHYHISLTILILAFLCGCGKSTSLIEKAEAFVERKATLDEIVAQLGTPNSTNQNPTLGIIIVYVEHFDQPMKWQGMDVSGVQIVIKDGRAERMFPILVSH